jgi:2-polyprenyl-6-methoxyphenol hydroxylase-like FAD-dependent oxidoreductase
MSDAESLCAAKGHVTPVSQGEAQGPASAIPLRVLVIGGGIGGLCLAQGLKMSGMDVAIYERDGSANSRAQGYRISIKEAGSHALRDCLPGRLFNLCVSTSIRPALRMVFMDHQLNQAFAKALPHAHDGPDPAGFGVNRLTLRQILLAGLDGIVQFGKTFTHFEHTGDGRIRAHFADGTAVCGDLLVGADGTNSTVRGLVVPDAWLDDLHYMMYGKTPINANTLDWLPEVLLDTFNNMNGPGGVRMAVATCRTWTPLAEATARFAPGLHLTQVPDYLSWTLSLGQEYRDADGATLHRLALGMLETWHPAVRRIVAEANVAAIFPINVQSARPVAPWHCANVTLLGDAIHTMSPGRGEGANTALRDAEHLRHALVDVATKGIPLAQAISAYEAEMLRYGFEAVASSRAQPFMARGTSPGRS